MAILVDLSIIPITKNPSASKYVKEALKIIKQNKLKFYAAPAMTTIEISEFSQLAKLLDQLYLGILGKEVKRMEVILKIDVRTDKSNTISRRLKAISK